MRILGICGSLRNGAYSLSALQACKEVAPPGFDFTVRRLLDIPMFNEDVYEADGYPPGVAILREEVAAADGIVISTPEYSHAIPGALKNALDWLHGEPGLLIDKPAAILSTAPGSLGGIRAQYELRMILQAMGAATLAKPEVYVAGSRTKFDASGTLTDENARKSLRTLMQSLEAWVERLRVPAIS
jgi:chromate reductase